MTPKVLVWTNWAPWKKSEFLFFLVGMCQPLEIFQTGEGKALSLVPFVMVAVSTFSESHMHLFSTCPVGLCCQFSSQNTEGKTWEFSLSLDGSHAAAPGLDPSFHVLSTELIGTHSTN